ncbi:MAG: amino acid ABC transporter permease [Peptococcaceae bacterium]|nr:amino acid ABC transporter permease [Peptococcaceae bacterium]
MLEFINQVLKIWKEYAPALWDGTITTLTIAIIGTLVGLGIGLVIGIYKTIPISPKDNIIKRVSYKIVDFILSAYIEIIRSTPMMVQAMLFYYGIAMVFNIQLNILLSGLIIVSVNTGAYMSEIVRGGIISIDHGQYEAAHSIGMTHTQTMSKIVLPQAIRNIMPSIGNEFIINIKDSCVLSVIGVTELFYVSKYAAGATFHYFETFSITLIYYFVLCFTITKILRYLEKRMDGPDSYTIMGSQTAPEAVIHVNTANHGKGE